jgi:error-prone DNA polymerase
MTRQGWGRLTRLLTLGNRRASKGDCILHLGDLLDHAQDMALIVTGPDRTTLETLGAACPGRVWLAATMLRAGADARRLKAAQALSASLGVPLIATNDALYASPDARPLHDILTCIREGVTIDMAGRRLAANAERHLKPPAEMARLFRACPEAMAATTDLLARIAFTLDDLRYEYPREPVPEDGRRRTGWSILSTRARAAFPDGLPERYGTVLAEEFA